MKVLVTGGSGYIGSKLMGKLLREGHQVTCVDNFMYGTASIMHLIEDNNLTVVPGDARDLATIEPIAQKADCIIPLACLTGAPLSAKDKIAAITTNRDAVTMLSKVSSMDQLIIYPCTNSGYGIGECGKFCTEDSPLKPLSVYGQTKVQAEEVLLEKGNAFTYRLATVFGVSPRPRLDLLVNDFTYRAYYDRFVVLFEANFKRNYLHIDDAVDGFIFAMNNPGLRGKPYNLGLSEANISKRELCEVIKKQLNGFVYFESEVGSDPDKRDYIVSNERIERAGFKAGRSLSIGISELIKALPLLKQTNFVNA